jgi:hypothetical protein
VAGAKRRVGARVERIKIKMGEAQSGVGEDKKRVREVRGKEERGEYCCFSKSILLFFRARAGLTYGVFFFIINRV